MKITPVQKQTRVGQRTRFKTFVGGGDGNGHVDLNVKCAKEAATAIRGAIIHAKPAGGLESWPPASPRRCCSSSASMMSSLPLVDPPRPSPWCSTMPRGLPTRTLAFRARRRCRRAALFRPGRAPGPHASVPARRVQRPGARQRTRPGRAAVRPTAPRSSGRWCLSTSSRLRMSDGTPNWEALKWKCVW